MTDHQAATPASDKTANPPLRLPDLTAPTPATIRIYVACLAAYNNGHLHGRWIDASLGEAHIVEQTRAMLKSSPIEEDAEEWAIHDYEGFEGASLSEYASFESVAALAEFIEEHGKIGGELVSYYGGNLEDAKTRLGEYHGEYESLEDYARQYTEDCGTQIPESLQNYIDYAAMGRDMELGGGFITIETAHNEIHIFGGA